MKTKRSRVRSGGALLWLLIVGAILVGVYLVFGVMGLQHIKDKIDEDLGKKPATAARGDEGALLIHQEHLRKNTEALEQAAGAAVEMQAKADAQRKRVEREAMEAEERQEATPAP